MNFTLTETPFAVTLNIKKSFINDKSGSVKNSGFSSPNQLLKKSSSIKNTSNFQCNTSIQPRDLKDMQFKSSIPLMNIPTYMAMVPTSVTQSTQKQIETNYDSTHSSVPMTASKTPTTVLTNLITSSIKQDSMFSSRDLKIMKDNSHSDPVNISDYNNNPQLFSEPNVTTRNRFKALENLSDDSCAEEQNAAFDDVAAFKNVDEKENYEKEKCIEGKNEIRSTEKNEVKKTCMTPEQEKFLEHFGEIVLGTYRPK